MEQGGGDEMGFVSGRVKGRLDLHIYTLVDLLGRKRTVAGHEVGWNPPVSLRRVYVNLKQKKDDKVILGKKFGTALIPVDQEYPIKSIF